MEQHIFSNPFILTFGGLALLVVLYVWNKKNQTNLRNRKNKTFKHRYTQRKKSSQENR
ncbi:MAG: hypothetical protein ACR2MH_03140 [Patiriisocius sp.]